MKPPQRILSLAILYTGIICALYDVYLTLFYGFFNISFSWFFALIALCFIPCASYALHKKQHLLYPLPHIIQRIVCILFVVGIGFFSMVEGYILYVGQQTSTHQSDTVLVLGAQLNGNQISRSLRYRLDAARTFYQEYPNVQIIVSGGQGTNESVSEAHAMRDYLVAHGIPKNQILMEDTSRNTQENIRNSYKRYLLQTNSSNNINITLITNSFHMARAKFIANQHGITTVNTYPAKTDLDLAPVFYVREFFGFCKDFLLSL